MEHCVEWLQTVAADQEAFRQALGKLHQLPASSVHPALSEAPGSVRQMPGLESASLQVMPSGPPMLPAFERCTRQGKSRSLLDGQASRKPRLRPGLSRNPQLTICQFGPVDRGLAVPKAHQLLRQLLGRPTLGLPLVVDFQHDLWAEARDRFVHAGENE